MAGLWPEGRDREAGERVYIDNLRWAADRVAGAGLTAVIEPINTRDIPGYFSITRARQCGSSSASARPI